MTLVFVHGFGDDPKSDVAEINPNRYLFPRWERMLDREPHQSCWHSWYSVPRTPQGIWRAWRQGHWNRYEYAWDLAQVQARILAKDLRRTEQPPDILCHSLGSRVVLGALALGAPASRVIILNGAEYLSAAAAVAQARPDVEFFSVCVKEDDVLNILGRFAPGVGTRFVGNTVLGLKASSNWTDLPLDDINFRGLMKTLYGWELAGDNPDSAADHHYSYLNPDNWPLYRAILARSWPPPKETEHGSYHR